MRETKIKKIATEPMPWPLFSGCKEAARGDTAADLKMIKECAVVAANAKNSTTVISNTGNSSRSGSINPHSSSLSNSSISSGHTKGALADLD